MTKKLSACLLLFFGIGYQATAQPDTILIDNKDAIVELGRYSKYLIDVDDRFGLNDVMQPENENQFHYEADPVPNFSNSTESVWFKFSIRNTTNFPLYLQIANLYIENINLYLVDPSGKVNQIKSGLQNKSSSTDYFVDKYVIPIEVQDDERTFMVYGHLQTKGKHFWVPMHIGTLPALTGADRLFEMVSIGTLAILLAMFFYNACLMVVIRQKVYLFYVFYVFTAMLYQGYYGGYFFYWFPSLLKQPMIGNIPIACLYLGLQLFINELLTVKQKLPKVYLFSYLIYFVIGMIILSPLLPKWIPYLLLDFMNFAFPVYLVVVGLLSFKKYKVVTVIFFSGWLPLMGAAILFVLMRNGFFYDRFFQVNAVGLAMVWEVIFFSLMLGYRFNQINQDKLEAQSENLKLINEHNQLLEKEVKVRTQEITMKNKELLQHQEEILTQRDMLEKQNQDLYESRQIINQHNHLLEIAVQQRTLELAQTNEELKNQFHQLEQFSFITAHNLRGPVARILGLANIFDFNNPSNSENKHILKKILESAKDIDTVIHDLGTILNVQQKKSELIEPILFYELTHKIKNRFAKEISENKIDIQVHSSVECLYSISAYIDSILTNLISNAVKYISPKRPPRISVELNEKGEMFNLVVEDNGIGFDAEKFADKIFEPFQRFNTHKEGKGLGMFLIKTQVTALNGTVNLQSKIDQGTRVEIAIPKLKVEA